MVAVDQEEEFASGYRIMITKMVSFIWVSKKQYTLILEVLHSHAALTIYWSSASSGWKLRPADWTDNIGLKNALNLFLDISLMLAADQSVQA